MMIKKILSNRLSQTLNSFDKMVKYNFSNAEYTKKLASNLQNSDKNAKKIQELDGHESIAYLPQEDLTEGTFNFSEWKDKNSNDNIGYLNNTFIDFANGSQGPIICKQNLYDEHVFIIRLSKPLVQKSKNPLPNQLIENCSFVININYMTRDEIEIFFLLLESVFDDSNESYLLQNIFNQLALSPVFYEANFLPKPSKNPPAYPNSLLIDKVYSPKGAYQFIARVATHTQLMQNIFNLAEFAKEKKNPLLEKLMRSRYVNLEKNAQYDFNKTELLDNWGETKDLSPIVVQALVGIVDNNNQIPNQFHVFDKKKELLQSLQGTRKEVLATYDKIKIKDDNKAVMEILNKH